MEYLQMRGYLIVCRLKRFSLVAMIRSNLLNSVNCTHIPISVSWKLFSYDTIQINWTRLFEDESQLSFLLEIFFLKRCFFWKKKWRARVLIILRFLQQFSKYNQFNRKWETEKKKQSLVKKVDQNSRNLQLTWNFL